jgi:hypothetical protein
VNKEIPIRIGGMNRAPPRKKKRPKPAVNEEDDEESDKRNRFVAVSRGLIVDGTERKRREVFLRIHGHNSQNLPHSMNRSRHLQH